MGPKGEEYKRLLQEGYSFKQIADTYGVTEATVRDMTIGRGAKPKAGVKAIEPVPTDPKGQVNAFVKKAAWYGNLTEADALDAVKEGFESIKPKLVLLEKLTTKGMTPEDARKAIDRNPDLETFLACMIDAGKEVKEEVKEDAKEGKKEGKGK